METLESGGVVAAQFLEPGPALEAVLDVIGSTSDRETTERLPKIGLPTRRGNSGVPVFERAYMVYEARLARPGRDVATGRPLLTTPFADVGSHRLYFLEVTAIGLRGDIAAGHSQIRWRSLATWESGLEGVGLVDARPDRDRPVKAFWKDYRPDYSFPAPGTVAFEADTQVAGMAVKHLPSLPEAQVETDNERARWPCFFPASVGMITSWLEPGIPALMPCGSTTIVSRHPLVVAIAIASRRINDRYTPRVTLELVEKAGRFGCGVPVNQPEIVRAIAYAGNVSIKEDPDKVRHAGLAVDDLDGLAVLPALPVHFDCKLIDRIDLGTHALVLGEATRVLMRRDVDPARPLLWYPWPDVTRAR